MKAFVTFFLIFVLGANVAAFSASRDSERLQALKEQIAKEELRSKELTARATRLENEIGTFSTTIPNPQTLKNLDDSLAALQDAPKNFLTTEDVKKYNFFIDYNLKNVSKAYASLYSYWEAYHYIVYSHMQDYN